MPTASTSYANGSVFSVHLRTDQSLKKLFETRTVSSQFGANEPSFDLAVVQFDDDGRPGIGQVDAAVARVREVRQAPASLLAGALVVVFIHGWHHGGEWHRTASIPDDQPDGDDHFHGFRRILQSLTYREMERPSSASGLPAGRRVIGVYLTWNGDPQSGFLGAVARLPRGSEASFWDRYGIAERIGAAHDLRETLRRIVIAVKHEPGPESPLVLIGHSMGALMMQSAYATLLEQGALVPPPAGAPAGPTRVISNGAPVLFPDLVLSLNSAADSDYARRILTAYESLGLTKVADGAQVGYNAPLLVSVTSATDTATRDWWPRARWGRLTDGHDPTLVTHSFRLQASPSGSPCLGVRGVPDFGQSWHCIHEPRPPRAATPSILVDLPTRERTDLNDRNVEHVQYELAPRRAEWMPCLQWIFQVPEDVIAEHNEIFQPTPRALILALIQISGAVASLARDWDDTFVP
jgi:hypothetical protein